ncbi:Alpha/beta hydrolase fold-1 [Mycena maculata]|uniref:Alpha/beta hydrolase fold-1 n=1 Tax=Mycena maculata TaxID=230809 RepID=A0AAD7N3N2_9AGAR|nr:Alpha/beta hydrolase fold-1 [Mycena maculata]
MIGRDEFTFKLPSGLRFAANRYVESEPANADGGLTFIFAHCASAHKEQWELTIETLFGLAKGKNCEAWALDCQSHGASAELNAGLLGAHNPIGIEEYASMLHWFVENGPIRAERCVAVGHSSSTSAWVLACTLFPVAPLRALVLIEPVLISFPDHQDLIDLGKVRVKAVSTRRDKWESPDELAAWMKRRHPWTTWDPRIFDIHLESLTPYRHGFKWTDTDVGRVLTPKCSTAQESRLYTHEPHVRAGELLHTICGQVPVHAIFAESADFVSLKARNAICDVSAGRTMASISIIQRTGHLAIQEQPKATAVAIFNAIFPTKAHL